VTDLPAVANTAVTNDGVEDASMFQIRYATVSVQPI